MGSLLNAITDESKIKYFQPTNINMGLFPPLEVAIRDKAQRKEEQIKKAQAALTGWTSS
jgi:folate-dependent tRNA-U54 methylase TrmFO/GidA